MTDATRAEPFGALRHEIAQREQDLARLRSTWQAVYARAEQVQGRLEAIEFEVRRVTELVAGQLARAEVASVAALLELDAERRALLVELPAWQKAIMIARGRYDSAQGELNVAREMLVQGLSARGKRRTLSREGWVGE